MTLYARFQDPPPPTREFHFAYGAVGAGDCANCGDLRSLFVHSAFHTADDCNPYCFNCIATLIVTEYRNAEMKENECLKDMWRDYHALWMNLETTIQLTREEVLAHPQGCQACARLGYSRYLVTAVSLTDGTEGLVHTSCTNKCGDCENTFYNPYNLNRPSMFARLPEMHRISRPRSGIKYVCTPCFEQYTDMVECDNCCSWEHEIEMEYLEFADVNACRSCVLSVETCNDCDQQCWDISDHECDQRYSIIKSWDFVPYGGFTFHGSDDNRMFMGFELEVEAESADRHEGAVLANSYLEDTHRGYLKYDGSIEDGFEIVTQPHTLDEYMQHFPWHMVDELREQGFRSWDTDTCGFHVHVNRETFGWRRQGSFNRGKYEAHLLRFTKLIYDNQRHVRRIAGRSSQRWASYSDAGNLTRKIREGYQSNSRYSAVNVGNTNTIEVRVFKGSLAVPRIKTYLQFIHSVTEYTRDLHVSPNENNLMWTRYRGWLAKNDEKYPELVSFLSTRTDDLQGDN